MCCTFSLASTSWLGYAYAQSSPFSISRLLVYVCKCWFMCVICGCVYIVTPVYRQRISISRVFYSNVFVNLGSPNLSMETYAFSLAISAVISAGGLLVWHSYLIYTNQVCAYYYATAVFDIILVVFDKSFRSSHYPYCTRSF